MGNRSTAGRCQNHPANPAGNNRSVEKTLPAGEIIRRRGVAAVVRGDVGGICEACSWGDVRGLVGVRGILQWVGGWGWERGRGWY